MELAFSAVAAAADANFLDGVQANNVTKELTRTGIAEGEEEETTTLPLILPQYCEELLRSQAERNYYYATLYRDEINSLQIQLSRTQAGPGRAVKEQQEQNSPNYVQRINIISVDCLREGGGTTIQGILLKKAFIVWQRIRKFPDGGNAHSTKRRTSDVANQS